MQTLSYSTNKPSHFDFVRNNSDSKKYVCSPLNYIGGKYKLLPQLLPLFPKNIHTFVDLFCGGCNVGINTEAQFIVFNDNLSYLIDLYHEFQTHDPDYIFTHIENQIALFNLSLTNEEGYRKIRELYNSQRNPLDLFVLTAYSFNHQIRFNNSHKFNNPFGKDRSCYNSRMKYNLNEFLKAIHKKKAKFCCKEFTNYDFSNLNENDYVYCDPPYLITTGTYNDGKRGFSGWSEKEELLLLEILSSLNNKGVKFGLSNVLTHKANHNHLLVNWIEKNNFIITHLHKDYSNSNYHIINRKKDSTDEVLVTNYQPTLNFFVSEPTI